VRLADVCLAHAPDAAKDALAAAPGLDGTLDRLVEEGRRAWPAVALEPARFVAHLAARLPVDGDPFAALAATHAGDLFLACACSLGVPEALAAFDEHFLSQVTRYLARGDALPQLSDEVKQALRAELLVRQRGPLPRIGGYTGRGPLGAWLRVVATRTALRLHDAGRRAGDPEPEAEPVLAAAAVDPELEYLKSHHREDFGRAFEEALAALEPRAGVILRLFYLDGMTVSAIGGLYGVSGRTVQRWISDARETILDETRRRLAERLQLPPEELAQVMRLLLSRLDVSIWRHFVRETGR
jgi:RNA polymerase sigma-70 factor (ECF subfamily)